MGVNTINARSVDLFCALTGGGEERGNAGQDERAVLKLITQYCTRAVYVTVLEYCV